MGIMTSFRFVTFIMILCCMAIAQGTQHLYNEFCSDNRKVENVFSMNSVAYLGKGDVLYYKTMDEKFAGKMSVNPKNIFRTGLKTISTGFFVSVIPPCPFLQLLKNEKCKELEKLEQLVFVIGYNPDSNRQSYASFRYDSKDTTSFFPIKDDSEMPFGLKAETEITEDFWPRSSDENTIYVASTYHKRSYAIAHVIQVDNDLILFIKYLTDAASEWKSVRNPTWSYPSAPSMDNTISQFKGFIRMRNPYTPEVITTYALVSLKGQRGETLLHFDPEYNKYLQTQRYFMSQVAINLTVDVYGCSDYMRTKPPSITQTSESTERVINSDDNSESKDMGDRESTTLSDIDEAINHWREDGRVPKKKKSERNSSGATDSSIVEQIEILTWIMVVVYIIAFILFIVMLSTVVYIGHLNRKRKAQKKRLNNS